MSENQNQEQRIKRLETAVRVLTVLFILSIGFSMYVFYQITTVTSKIPSYSELKEDVKSIKQLYDKSVDAMPGVKDKVSKGYNYTKDKVADGYDYTKEKVSDGYDYTKEKTNAVIDYFSGDDSKEGKTKGSDKSKSKK